MCHLGLKTVKTRQLTAVGCSGALDYWLQHWFLFQRMKAEDHVGKKQQWKCLIHNILANLFYLAKTAWSKIFHSSSEILFKFLSMCYVLSF